VLLDVWDGNPSERRDVVWLAGHDDVGADEVDVELRPDCGADERGHGESDRLASIAGGLACADLEAEPVTEVAGYGLAQVGLRNLERLRAIHVDIDRGANTDVARKEGGGALYNPAVIDEVEALEQTVVSHLSLQLGECPLALLSDCTESVGERPPERFWAAIERFLAHRGMPVRVEGAGALISAGCWR
jgi:hypothetical protein